MSISTYQLLKSLGVSERRVLQLLPTISGGNYAAGDVICPKGANKQPWTHVFSGLVFGGIPNTDGGIDPVHIFGPNTWFGEASIVSRQPSSMEYACLTDVRVMHLPWEATIEAFEREPDFSRYIALLVTLRSQQSSELLSLMRFGSPAQRVVMGMALIAEALLQPHPTLRPSANWELASDRLDISVKQALMASMCGVSRGIFSVCINQLERASWCEIQYGTISLLQIKAWIHFSAAQRHNRIHMDKPAMPEILLQLDAAAQECRSDTNHLARHA